jgi:hypothetical protein
MSNKILKALGIETIPPGTTEFELTCKVLRDPWIAKRSHDLMVETFSELAILKMTPAEKAAFLKKLVPAPVASVRWEVGQGAITEQWFIKASGHSQETFFTGTPEKARAFTFCGETCPAVVVAEYKSVYVYVGGGQQAEELAKANIQPRQEHAPIEGPR